MTWKTDPKYRTPEHRRTRARYARQLKRDGRLECAQPICVEDSRTILPGTRWAAGHDDTGRHYIGPVHASCNLADAQRRGVAAAQGGAPLPDVAAWFA